MIAGVSAGASRQAGFGDRLAERVAERRSQIVLGLDPDPMGLWPQAVEVAARESDLPAAPAERAAAAVRRHCELAIDAVAEHCVGVKVQLACFERLGAAGWTALYHVADHARGHGLLVIADAKRGDIDVSAKAYAQALLGQTQTPFGPVSGLKADALTVNPLLGADSLAPFVEIAREEGAGLFVLVRTSNPGARDVQDQALADGGTVSEHLARLVAEIGALDVGQAGLSNVGAVVGATAPERLQGLRELMPQAILLLPGVGAQGGTVEALAPAFAPGPAGALITASRSIVGAGGQSGRDPSRAAAQAAGALRELAWALAS